MHKTPRISYIVCTKNRRAFVELALPRWKELKGDEDEFVFIDGLSSDGTAELVEDLDWVDIFQSEKDVSEAHGFNKGILAARGKYLKLLTDDDEFFREGIERACEVMERRSEIDILHTGGECVQIQGERRVTLWYQKWDGADSPVWWGTRCGLGALIRRASIPLIGLIDTRHKLADTSFFLQAVRRGARMRFLQVKTFRHVRHASSYTGTVRRAEWRRMTRMVLTDHRVPFSLRMRLLYPRASALCSPLRMYQALRRRLRREPAVMPEPNWDGQLH